MFDSDWLADITKELERIGPVRSEQTALIRRCVGFIDRQIPEGPPLWEACPRADVCWRRDQGPRPKPMSVRIPYVGPDYPNRRIAVVAINSRDCGRAGDEVRATAEVLASLRAGRREYGRRSFFHYRVACAIYDAIRSLDGEAINELPDPSIAGGSLLASARLQAVQCSPQSTSRRTPTPEMLQSCPEFLLRGQLEILEPRVLLLFGEAAHQAIEKPPLVVEWDTTWQDSGHCFSRGQTILADQGMTALAFHHPSYVRWSRSWNAYRSSLRSNPLVNN